MAATKREALAPVAAEGCCMPGMRALFHQGSGRLLQTRRAGALAQRSGQDHVRCAVVAELRSLEESLDLELTAIVQRLSKAASTAPLQPAPILAKPKFTANCEVEEQPHEEDLQRISPRRRRDRRRYTVASDGNESLTSILNRNMMGHSSCEEDEHEPEAAASETARKTLHPRFAERLNEVHKHQVEPEERGGQEEDERLEDAKSDMSTPSCASCASTSWRVDALDVGDKLAATTAAKKGGVSVDSIGDLVETERERWAEEKQALEARVEELKERLALFKRGQDPEVVALRRQIDGLRQAVKVRSRFGAWVCERHMQESDDEEEGSIRNADKEVLRKEMQTLEAELRQARIEAGCASPTSPSSPSADAGSTGAASSGRGAPVASAA